MLTTNDHAEIRRAVVTTGKLVLALLVRREFAVLEAMTSGKDLSADQLRAAWDASGASSAEPGEEVWSQVPIQLVTDGPTTAPRYEVVVPLGGERGRAARGLALRLAPTAYGTFDPEIRGFVPFSSEAPANPEPDSVAATTKNPTHCPKSVHQSDRPVPERWRPILEGMVRRLVGRDYAGLAADRLVSFTDDPEDASIGRWIEEYPATLVDLPPEAWSCSEFGAAAGMHGAWWVIVDLWTAEEGHSDLSMEATVWDDGAEVRAVIDNVHVL